MVKEYHNTLRLRYDSMPTENSAKAKHCRTEIDQISTIWARAVCLKKYEEERQAKLDKDLANTPTHEEIALVLEGDITGVPARPAAEKIAAFHTSITTGNLDFPEPDHSNMLMAYDEYAKPYTLSETIEDRHNAVQAFNLIEGLRRAALAAVISTRLKHWYQDRSRQTTFGQPEINRHRLVRGEAG